MGIETCFYNGLDAYAKTWFQFLFPLYIWLIVITIIVSSHHSTRVSRLSGKNAVQVLATLFLLSYAKLLRIIITTFSATQLVYPNGHHKLVWLYDGNVDYFRGKHIPLFIASLILLIFVSVPYTVGLLCVQVLQKYSNLKVLFWDHLQHLPEILYYNGMRVECLFPTPSSNGCALVDLENLCLSSQYPHTLSTQLGILYHEKEAHSHWQCNFSLVLSQV